jgi:hypothetical protein
MEVTKQMIYRDHTISERNNVDGFGAVFGGDWRNISGPLCNGGTGGGARGAKRMIDQSIREHECKEKTGHKNVTERSDRRYCADCGAYRGTVPKPGEGARYTFYRDAANGHKYGWSVKRDRFGKWYAVDQSRKAPGRGWETRLVKCATRAKAKAKATEWWRKAQREKTA